MCTTTSVLLENMKIQDIHKKAPNNDAFSTLSPLNYALKIFGLSCIYRDGKTLKYHCPIWKMCFCLIIFFAVNAYSIYFKVQSSKNRTSFTFMDSLQMAYLLGYIQYISDVIFVYKYGRQPYVDYFIHYDYIDSILGMPNYKKIKRSIGKMCFFFSFIGLILTIIDFFTWVVTFDNWLWLSVYSIEYVYLVIRMLSALDIISNGIQIKYRLETIGNLLENYYNQADNLPGVIKDVIYDKVWIGRHDNIKKMNRLDSLNTVSNGRHNMILWLSRCYILLNEQSDFINVKYGFRILLSCTIYLLDMVLMLNLLIRLMRGTLILPNRSIYLPLASTFVRFITYSLVLFCAINLCEQCYRQTERMLRFIDHILINKKNISEIRDSLKELKDLITSRPINFHALHFYRLDYATSVSMASVIVTYTIILLQNLQ